MMSELERIISAEQTCPLCQGIWVYTRVPGTLDCVDRACEHCHLYETIELSWYRNDYVPFVTVEVRNPAGTVSPDGTIKRQ